MLARSFRLCKKDLTSLYQKGKKLREGYLLLRVLENRKVSPRFAIIIPKKVAAKAVDRARLKRKTAIILDEYKTKLGHFDIAIAYQKFPASEEDIKNILSKALSQIKER